MADRAEYLLIGIAKAVYGHPEADDSEHERLATIAA